MGLPAEHCAFSRRRLHINTDFLFVWWRGGGVCVGGGGGEHPPPPQTGSLRPRDRVPSDTRTKGLKGRRGASKGGFERAGFEGGFETPPKTLRSPPIPKGLRPCSREVQVT